MLTMDDMRASVLETHGAYARSRAIPAVYVVNERLRVLWSHHDPSERRRDCRSQDDSLPPIVADTVQRLIATRERSEPPPDTLVSAASASLLVRVIWLVGSPQALAVLVERLRIRDYVASARKRFLLTAREAEVLELVVDGRTNEEIGKALNIAKSTAVFHVKRLLVKLQVRNRTELVTRFLS
jgi:DNA-binding CsgD family transcriptional regulator